ncbi:hypothetical protein [Hydrogenophaga sp. BPS33]|uniref:hypothetical protein n=1 Tax=Hydrogenophaga sp. BPS33 TaxID=2651974 RepID=UPI00131FC318|nr:hypothetical protein [Hydrogenophaga sp. BPS33]QHE85394.1 hypothetical protein F9K07_11035 [Hydrogenophaga sp. BPS33]
MSIEYMYGWPLRRVHMPNGDQLVLMYCETGDEPQLELHKMNHNVYRRNAQGEILWQVQRNDSNHPPGWWDELHRQARAEGLDGAREPFMRIWVENADGTFQSEPDGRTPAMVQTWTSGCTLHLDGSAYQHYILDPDTGIAKNVTKLPVRPW